MSADAVVFHSGTSEHRLEGAVVRVEAPTDVRLKDMFMEGVILNADHEKGLGAPAKGYQPSGRTEASAGLREA